MSLPREAHWVHYVPCNDIIFGFLVLSLPPFTIYPKLQRPRGGDPAIIAQINGIL